MALSPTAIAELKKMLQSFHVAHHTAAIPSGPGKALEAWLLVKLAAAARAAGWTVTLCRGDGSAVPPNAQFKLPGNPGAVSPSDPARPGFVRMASKTGEPIRLELHGSLQWYGRSTAKHECDISVLPATVGESLRKSGGGYPRGLPVLAIECKDRTDVGNLDEMRQKLARLFDLALVTKPAPGMACRIYEANGSVKWGKHSSRYLSYFAKGTFGIARSTHIRPSAKSLGKYYSIEPFENIYDVGAASVTQLVQSFLRTLQSIASF